MRDLTRRWAAAEVAADTTALDALACPDFRLVGPAGFVPGGADGPRRLAGVHLSAMADPPGHQG